MISALIFTLLAAPTAGAPSPSAPKLAAPAPPADTARESSTSTGANRTYQEEQAELKKILADKRLIPLRKFKEELTPKAALLSTFGRGPSFGRGASFVRGPALVTPDTRVGTVRCLAAGCYLEVVYKDKADFVEGDKKIVGNADAPIENFKGVVGRTGAREDDKTKQVTVTWYAYYQPRPIGTVDISEVRTATDSAKGEQK